MARRLVHTRFCDAEGCTQETMLGAPFCAEHWARLPDWLRQALRAARGPETSSRVTLHYLLVHLRCRASLARQDDHPAAPAVQSVLAEALRQQLRDSADSHGEELHLIAGFDRGLRSVPGRGTPRHRGAYPQRAPKVAAR